jgi:hypothetical protein
MQWVPLALMALVGIPMGLLINYVIWFKFLPMIFRMFGDRRKCDHKNSN